MLSFSQMERNLNKYSLAGTHKKKLYFSSPVCFQSEYKDCWT